MVKKAESLVNISKYFGLADAADFLITKALLRYEKYTEKFLRRRKIFYIFSGIHFPVCLRMHTSDEDSYEQIFIQNEYSPLLKIKNPKLIVDCGGYVGLSSIWFLNQFPTASIVTIEPDPENFSIASRNLRMYKERVRLINAAVWPKITKLQLEKGKFLDGKDWSNQVKESNNLDSQIQAIDIPTILKESKQENIDILKIDIERSEIELFSKNYETWLPKVKNIVIELHDEKCREVFFKALADYTFEKYNFRELTFCLNLKSKIEIS